MIGALGELSASNPAENCRGGSCGKPRGASSGGADGDRRYHSCVVDTAAVFVRNDVVPLSIIGGTGVYQNARGDGTVQLVTGVPNLADATSSST